jgi:23S rRNA pseudouridine2605 synthase
MAPLPTRERIQKLLAARGIGSRRKVEMWIAAGRVTVNGRPARPGQPVEESDDIRLDGRRLRLTRAKRAEHAGIAYHRPAQEEIHAVRPAEKSSSIERLPKATGRRWIPVSPLPPSDGGLEVFVTDGELAAALTHRGFAIESEFGVRVRGDFDAATVETAIKEASRGTAATDRITDLKVAGGAGTNRWLQVKGKGLRPRELRQVLEAYGLEANRILRTRYGPIAMERALARGRSRRLTGDEMQALREAAGLPVTGSRTTAR